MLSCCWFVLCFVQFQDANINLIRATRDKPLGGTLRRSRRYVKEGGSTLILISRITLLKISLPQEKMSSIEFVLKMI